MSTIVRDTIGLVSEGVNEMMMMIAASYAREAYTTEICISIDMMKQIQIVSKSGYDYDDIIIIQLSLSLSLDSST